MTFQGQKVEVTRACDHHIEATVTWNMMVTKYFIFGPTLTNGGQALKCLKLPLYGVLYIRYAYRKYVGVDIFHLTF